MESSSIKVGPTSARDRRRRKREFFLGIGALFLIILLSWGGLRYFGVNSFLFLGLFNLNLILLLLILFLVLRNGVKLILERKRRVLGAKLRTRLVLAFMSLTLLPTIPMFFVSIKFVQTSVDYWFKNQVEHSMEQALEVGQAYYNNALDDLREEGSSILERIRDNGLDRKSTALQTFLQQERKAYGLVGLGLLDSRREEGSWEGLPKWNRTWPEIKNRIDWAQVGEEEMWSTLWPGTDTDFLVGIIPLENDRGYLVLGSPIGHGFFAKLDQIVKGVDEYKKLKTLKYPLKMVLYLFLGVMTLLIIFGAMWFGFRLAKELSAPVQALALGTQRIASGDLGVRLDDESEDELGVLVQSFNIMAEDLEQSRESLTRANIRLAQQNQVLEERGEYMEAVLNNITAGVISLDSSGNISTVNRAAEAMLGLDSRKLLGTSPLDILPEKYTREFTDLFFHLKDNPGSQWQRQIEMSVGNRELKLLVNVVALKTMEGSETGLVAVFEDITELEKMQRMAAWREVARRIAHEIKNPLTPIKLSAQRMEQKYGNQIGDETFSQCTDLIVSQVEHLQKMVKEFSSFAKIPEVILRENDLVPLLEEVLDIFKNSHSAIEWRLYLENELPRFKFDQEAMRRVLVNLLTNAAEALDGIPEARVDVHARYNSESGWVQVEVRDNGPGLTQEERSRMFEPYFSKKKGGTGLGLTIVKSIVSDHHGYVRVHPNEPTGSIFVMELPVTA